MIENLYECESCARKPGSPALCHTCLDNRKAAGDAWRGQPLLYSRTSDRMGHVAACTSYAAEIAADNLLRVETPVEPLREFVVDRIVVTHVDAPTLKYPCLDTHYRVIGHTATINGSARLSNGMIVPIAPKDYAAVRDGARDGKVYELVLREVRT